MLGEKNDRKYEVKKRKVVGRDTWKFRRITDPNETVRRGQRNPTKKQHLLGDLLRSLRMFVRQRIHGGKSQHYQVQLLMEILLEKSEIPLYTQGMVVDDIAGGVVSCKPICHTTCGCLLSCDCRILLQVYMVAIFGTLSDNLCCHWKSCEVETQAGLIRCQRLYCLVL